MAAVASPPPPYAAFAGVVAVPELRFSFGACGGSRLALRPSLFGVARRQVWCLFQLKDDLRENVEVGEVTFHSKMSTSSRSGDNACRTVRVRCSNGNVSVDTRPAIEVLVTGDAYDFSGATAALVPQALSSPKKVTLVRHGLSSWNAESRIQGSSNLSVLTETGAMQAERCQNALALMEFDACFSSPISRAKSTAELIWKGKEHPLVFLDSLKEAHLFFLEGMTNADAKKQYPELYTKWREDPANFHVNGVYPIRSLWGTAREAWKEILMSKGENFLVITHKSILRALICTALGLGPDRFRAIDVNNGGISVFAFNQRGEAMLQALNMTAHMYSDYVYKY